MRVVCFGAGPAFKGGMSNYNTSLAKALDRIEGVDVDIVSWTEQYPSIVPREFKDKKSKLDLLEGTDIQVTYLTNYNNPFSWQRTVRFIRDLKPDMVIIQWSIAIQGIPLSYIAKRLKRAAIEVIFDLHFVIQKENSSLDQRLTRLALRHASTYIVHALKTYRELEQLFPDQRFQLTESGERTHPCDDPAVLKLYHPVYDIFSPDPDFDKAAFKASFGLKEHVFLFFGFIRKYKGLHNTIQAFAKVAEQREDVSLLICGESFWKTVDDSKWSVKLKRWVFGIAKSLFLKKEDDEGEYRPLEWIEKLNLQDRTAVVNEFVPNEDVHKYFQVSNAGILFYLTATPSGVESLNYNFRLPVIATRVGHFPETIRDGYNGYLAEPEDLDSMAEAMMRFLDTPIPAEHVTETAQDMSWDNYARAILNRT